LRQRSAYFHPITEIVVSFFAAQRQSQHRRWNLCLFQEFIDPQRALDAGLIAVVENGDGLAD
jgi:enoyl-CoA hydratase/carnithine racemase